MRIDVVTTFPELFAAVSPGVLGVSIPARAIAAGALEVVATNIRDFATDKHHKTDDRPFGGGPGMVMLCQPLFDAVMAVEAKGPPVAAPDTPAPTARRVLLTPQGVPLTQGLVEELAKEPRLVLIAGHYEGIDERVIDELAPIEVSLGDYVLSGGEIAALVLIDAIARLLPGVLGHELSSVEDSFGRVDVPAAAKPSRREREQARKQALTAALESPATPTPPTPTPAAAAPAQMPLAQGFAAAPADLAGRCVRLLDCPQYTKPREWRGREVPEVLLSGDHARIAAWRLEQRIARTRARRPELLG
jgi:tRNA (guanine37-N1)-methyltransferase